MNNFYRLALTLAGFASLQASAVDMAAMEKWGNAKVVKYRIEGEHSARISVVHGDYEGKADVIDHLTVEFTWDLNNNKFVGPVTVKDGKSALKNLKSDGTNCPPPTLNGEYEHFQSVSNSLIGSDLIEIKGVRVYPAASVSNYPGGCSMRPIPGARENVVVHVGPADPRILGMPELAQGGPVSVSSDGKSFSMKGAENWTWTFTPTIVQ
ncbi:MAG: hypothetical protein ACJ8MR_11765 [Povalibacter sp.]